MNSTTSSSIFISGVEDGNKSAMNHLNNESNMHKVDSDEQTLRVLVVILGIAGGIVMAILLACFFKSFKFCIVVRTLGRSLISGYHQFINWLFPCLNRTVKLRKYDSDFDFKSVQFQAMYVQRTASTESIMEMQRFHANGESVEGFLQLPPQEHLEAPVARIPIGFLRAHSCCV